MAKEKLASIYRSLAQKQHNYQRNVSKDLRDRERYLTSGEQRLRR